MDVIRNNKNDSLKPRILTHFEWLTGELVSSKKWEVKSKKYKSQRDSLQQQLVSINSDDTSDKNDAVREWESSKIADAIAGYEEDPIGIQKVMRILFNVEVEMFPGKKNETINLSYSVGMGLKFDVTPEDVFHHENRDKAVTFRVICPGVMNTGDNQVLRRAKLIWEGNKNE